MAVDQGQPEAVGRSMTGRMERAPRGRRSRQARTRLGRVFDALSWPAAVGVLGLSAAWRVSGWAWEVDLVANLTAQWLAAAAVLVLLWVITARWRFALIGLVSAALCVWALASGRAAVWPRPVQGVRAVEAGSDAAAASGVVRFLHYNASTYGDGPSIEAFMRETHADVLSILCPPVRQQAMVIYGHHLENEYRGKLVRLWRPEPDQPMTDVTAAFVVSPWGLRAFDTAWVGPVGDYLIAGVVERPVVGGQGGEFGLICVHPRSPRDAQRWEVGNAVVEGVALVAQRMGEQGLPVVVLTDLNSTPTGYRSRLLWREAGLRRAKPLLEAAGTYPDWVRLGLRVKAPTVIPARWPASLAIDDAVISPQIGVEGWQIGPKLESEHRPLLIELRIPGGGTGEGVGSGR